MDREKIGIIGLGNMGVHMANRLINAGYQVVAHDVNTAIEPTLTSMGASWVGSPKQVAETTGIVVLSLPTPKAVEEVLSGPDGVAQGNTVKIVIDTSTTGPDTTARMATLLQQRHIHLIDAPVSGGTTGAAEGTLTVMASGHAESYSTVVPLLECLGKKLFYLGESAGQGQTMKMINNTLCAAATLSAFEGLVLGSKAGLDSQTMIEVINASSGRSFATEVKIPQCIVNRNFPLRFTTELLHKDVKLCLDEAARMGVPMWVNDAARQMLSFAITQGGSTQDYGEVIKHYETWAGVQYGQAQSTTTTETA